MPGEHPPHAREDKRRRERDSLGQAATEVGHRRHREEHDDAEQRGEGDAVARRAAHRQASGQQQPTAHASRVGARLRRLAAHVDDVPPRVGSDRPVAAAVHTDVGVIFTTVRSLSSRAVLLVQRRGEQQHRQREHAGALEGEPDLLPARATFHVVPRRRVLALARDPVDTQPHWSEHGENLGRRAKGDDCDSRHEQEGKSQDEEALGAGGLEGHESDDDADGGRQRRARRCSPQLNWGRKTQGRQPGHCDDNAQRDKRSQARTACTAPAARSVQANRVRQLC
mmetsp:Transcript_22059/g.77320  ORF Transcript_22059/g.77320 Transcript_22059/m.77320 type:complete len:282 (-) Transcript_22059:2756-3601(-)